MRKSEALERFLRDNAEPHMAALYSPTMEVQVNVAADGGEPVDKEYKGRTYREWTDGVQVWKNFRIDGKYDEGNIKFSLEDHASMVGLSGWDFGQCISRYVAFDFDGIVGHSARHKHKLTQTDLLDIQQRACNVPWVRVQRSKSGAGYHLYVFFEDLITTTSRAEHAALARGVLSQLCLETGFDFDLAVDVFGCNMWVWSRKTGENGFQIIKEAEAHIKEPLGWRDHIGVVSGKKKHSYADDRMEEIIKHKQSVTLEEEHERLLEWMNNNSAFGYWNAEGKMFITHTKLLEQASKELGFKGDFQTISDGTDLHKQNCFAYPLPHGAWAVYRYGNEAKEHESWTTKNGWTRTYLNYVPPLWTLVKDSGALEDDKKGMVLPAHKLTKLFQQHEMQAIDEVLIARQATVTQLKENKLKIEIPKIKGDPGGIEGWIAKGTRWLKVIKESRTGSPYDVDTNTQIRHMIMGSVDAGWAIETHDNGWIEEPIANLTLGLKSQGMNTKEIQQMQGEAIMKPWNIVSRPFESEYPGNRLWNRGAAQLRHTPEEGNFDLWMKILDHIGHSLDQYVRKDNWFTENGICKGHDYLFAWVASLIQQPFEPLPFLFLYSTEQDTGKSILHEALSLLFSPGVVRAENALVSSFNSELAGAVLCVLEEINLNSDSTVYQKVKDYVTSKVISVNTKGKPAYMIPNTSHWIHTANNREFCPILPGDTRITVINVPKKPDKVIPKKLLLEQLEAQAPAFLYALLAYQIPPTQGRLNVPVVDTVDKEQAADLNRTDVELFARSVLQEQPGSKVELQLLYKNYMDDGGRANRKKFEQNLAEMYLIAIDEMQKTCIYNVRFSYEAPKDNGFRFVETPDGVKRETIKGERAT
ncbi:MAG: hypothetical protein CL489_06410 [Acidobacteria bacterium]|nr:hypothetical protein [Acidobacteriota bacterium]|tara:strand:- start:53806 stop:56412 length:2607 start_codon:yes stop_codon:yes gene_type:complete